MPTNSILARVGRLAPFGLTLLLPGIAVWTLFATRGMSTEPCGWPDPPFRGPIHPLIIVGACGLSFLAGHLFGYVRDSRHEPIERTRHSIQPGDAILALDTKRSLQGSLLMQSFVSLFLVIVVVLLVYETVSLIRFPRLWPITYYVRCANVVDAGWTLAGACLVCALAGHWFWHPKRT